VLRRTSRERFLLALSLPLFVVGVALAYRYNMWIGRFMVLPVALTMPLAAWLYSWRLASTLAVALACVFLPLAEVRNQLHPAPDAWRMSRVDGQTIIWPRLRPVIRAVDARVPADARLGYVLGSDDWSYPLYGPTLERRLEQLPRRRTLAVARRRGLSWVVVAHRVRGGDGYVATRLGHWTLLRYDASRLASSSRRRMNGFASLTISSR
jgi:hypothetical protein